MSFDSLKERGPRAPIPVSFSERISAAGGKLETNQDSDFPHDLDRKGNIGKDRFRKRIQRSLEKKLPDLIKKVPIGAENDGDLIHVHLPPEERPIFRRGMNQQKGYGSGKGEPGDVVAPGPDRGSGREAGHGVTGEGGYDIAVTAEDILKMVFQDWQLPDLDEKRVGEMTEETYRWDDRRKSGPFGNLDKKATIRANIKRQAMKQHKLPLAERTPVKFGDIQNEDLRFLAYSPIEKPVTNAVVFAMRDISVSIGEQEAYAAHVMLSWAVRFLRTQYTTVKIVFGTHHSTAKINLTQEQFFSPKESGGTDLLPALKIMNETIDSDYQPSEWNVYPFYVGDGEIYEQPGNESLKQEFTGLLDRSRRLFYAETSIRSGGQMGLRESSLMRFLTSLNDKRVISAKVNDRDGIGRALDTFFKKKEGGETEGRL